ncbi:MAG: glycosyltransferase, partial [Planctomycetes bacterium]|nr:glycosyltransferase [Planctomycetota bacterium]
VQLLVVADELLITPRVDISSTSIAWAMAAGVAVIGTAVHSVAEMIANKVNGLLFKQTPGRSMTPAILTCLRQRDEQRKAIEVARGHAYEAFGLRRCIEQYMQLYDNVLRGQDPGAGITDSAIVQ